MKDKLSLNSSLITLHSSLSLKSPATFSQTTRGRMRVRVHLGRARGFRFMASAPAEIQAQRTQQTPPSAVARADLAKERVLAVVIRLINDLYFRVGSESSVRRYRTYGVTTLRNRHLTIKRGGRLVFNFVGKHHIRQRCVLVDEDLATLMRDIQKLGGAKLFHYYDEEQKKAIPIRPRDVNDYIKAAAGAEVSAKDFRTWGGTLLAAVELAELGKAEDEQQLKRNIVKAIK